MHADNVFSFVSGSVKAFTAETKSGKEYYVEGHISSEDVDLVNDVVTRNCQKSMFRQFSERVIKLDLDHETLQGKSDIEKEISKTLYFLRKLLKI